MKSSRQFFHEGLALWVGGEWVPPFGMMKDECGMMKTGRPPKATAHSPSPSIAWRRNPAPRHTPVPVDGPRSIPASQHFGSKSGDALWQLTTQRSRPQTVSETRFSTRSAGSAAGDFRPEYPAGNGQDAPSPAASNSCRRSAMQFRQSSDPPDHRADFPDQDQNDRGGR